MDKEQAKALITTAGLEVIAETPLPDGHGVQLRTNAGPVVTIYNTGKCVLGGKKQELLRSHFEKDDGYAAPAAARQGAAGRKVFVVYGHNEVAKSDLEAMLRRWGLEPLILDQLPSGGQTIIEKLESVRAEAKYAVVLATPDDEGNRVGHGGEKALRSRQNVVLELGMMLAVLGRSRVAILMPSGVAMERPSDIQGLIYISYKDSVREAALTLAKEINAQGIPIDLSHV